MSDPTGSGSDSDHLAGIADVIRAAAMDQGEHYPCRLGVYCDRCDTCFEADFIVSTDMNQTERFDVVRAHVSRVRGWRCDERGDICDSCLARPSNVITGSAAGTVIQAHDIHGGPHL